MTPREEGPAGPNRRAWLAAPLGGNSRGIFDRAIISDETGEKEGSGGLALKGAGPVPPCPASLCERPSKRHDDSPRGLLQERVNERRFIDSSDTRESSNLDVHRAG